MGVKCTGRVLFTALTLLKSIAMPARLLKAVRMVALICA